MGMDNVSFISDRVESHTMSGCGMGEDVSSINHVVHMARMFQ